MTASPRPSSAGPPSSWTGSKLAGDEVVVDAGCGSGKITLELIRRVPRGTVYAVDAAPSMVRHTQEAVGDRATALCQDLVELSLPEPVDVVFSNATFHWIGDHDALFAALARNMKPGARLLAQCGGKGNIDRFRVLADKVAFEEPFAPYFADWVRPWNYATAEETAAAPGAGRLHRDLHVAGGEAHAARGAARLRQHGVPGPPPGPAARRAARPVRRHRARALRHARGARLRAPEHDRAASVTRHRSATVPRLDHDRPHRHPHSARRRHRPRDHRARRRGARRGRPGPLRVRGAPVRRGLHRRPRHGADRRDAGRLPRRPTPSCSPPSAAPSGTPPIPTSRGPSRGCSACARAWACSPTCARSSRCPRSMTPARSSARSSRAPTCSSSASSPAGSTSARRRGPPTAPRTPASTRARRSSGSPGSPSARRARA